MKYDTTSSIEVSSYSISIFCYPHPGILLAFLNNRVFMYYLRPWQDDKIMHTKYIDDDNIKEHQFLGNTRKNGEKTIFYFFNIIQTKLIWQEKGILSLKPQASTIFCVRDYAQSKVIMPWRWLSEMLSKIKSICLYWKASLCIVLYISSLTKLHCINFRVE